VLINNVSIIISSKNTYLVITDEYSEQNYFVKFFYSKVQFKFKFENPLEVYKKYL